jgi:hypothetical protein
MIDSVEPLSCVLWLVALFAAGMYPLGFMLGAPCSPCCDSNAGCTPFFHRCLRELSVDGSDPAKALQVPSREIFTHAEAALKRASETAIVSVTVTVPSLAAVHLTEGEQLVYQVSVGLSTMIVPGTFSAPADNPSAVVTITLVGRTLNPNDPAYREQAPPVVSGSTVTIYASPVSQTVTLSEIEIDLANTTQSGCTLQTCGARPTSAGVTRVSGRERDLFPQFYRPTVTASITSLALDKWIVDGSVMRDGFLLRELDFERAEQFLNGELAIRKQRQYTRFDPPTRTFIPVTDYVDVQVSEYSPLCEMPLCNVAPIQTKILDELLPTGVTYTPAANEKYGCKDGYEFVLGNPNGGCTYSHTTNECNSVVSRSIGLLEFWKQYSLDAVVNGRSTSAGFSFSSMPDVLTWMDYEPDPIVKSGATYTVGGAYDSAAGRYGKCLSGGEAWEPGPDGECYPYEVEVNVIVGFGGSTTDLGDLGECLINGAEARSGTYVLGIIRRPGFPVLPGYACNGARTYGIVNEGESFLQSFLAIYRNVSCSTATDLYFYFNFTIPECRTNERQGNFSLNNIGFFGSDGLSQASTIFGGFSNFFMPGFVVTASSTSFGPPMPSCDDVTY